MHLAMIIFGVGMLAFTTIAVFRAAFVTVEERTTEIMRQSAQKTARASGRLPSPDGGRS